MFHPYSKVAIDMYISIHAYFFLGLARACTSLYKLIQARKVSKSQDQQAMSVFPQAWHDFCQQVPTRAHKSNKLSHKLIKMVYNFIPQFRVQMSITNVVKEWLSYYWGIVVQEKTVNG